MRVETHRISGVNGSTEILHLGPKQGIRGVSFHRNDDYNTSVGSLYVRLVVDGTVVYQAGQDVDQNTSVTPSDPIIIRDRLLGQMMWLCGIDGDRVDLEYRSDGGAGSGPEVLVVLYMEE